jgi:hypothetical protein
MKTLATCLLFTVIFAVSKVGHAQFHTTYQRTNSYIYCIDDLDGGEVIVDFNKGTITWRAAGGVLAGFNITNLLAIRMSDGRVALNIDSTLESAYIMRPTGWEASGYKTGRY